MSIAAPSRYRPRVGDVVGGAYLLGEVLGTGGMGIVHAATVEGDREVAIKMLHPDLEAEADAPRRFRDEAIAAHYVAHSNVVSVLDYSEPDAPIPFVVMERVVGPSLGTILRRSGALPLQRAARLASQILAGLDAAHAAGVVHADVTSHNILVEPDHLGAERIKIIDFGLASVRRPDHPRRSDLDVCPKLVSGTPEYMAPEVIRGGEAVPASDLYGVGVIVYEMMTGDTPFAGGAPATILERHLTEDAVSPSARRPDRFIPIAFERAIMRALEKDPAKRHASAASFAAALTAATPTAEPGRLEPFNTQGEGAFSTEATTCNNLPGQRASAPTVGRLVLARRALAKALHDGTADEAVVAALELSRMLVDDHMMADAVHQLECTVDALTKGAGIDDLAAPAPLWRVLLILAALYQGLGDPARARRAAAAAQAHARQHRSEIGKERAATLLQRLRRWR